VDEMPLMYAQNTLQMEWCLDCHRNPAKNLRPTSQIYNMAWKGPEEDQPVWCAANDQPGVPTAQGVSCTTKDPSGAPGGAMASLQLPAAGARGIAGDVAAATMPAATLNYQKFTSQEDLGKFLVVHYNIRTPKDLMSCEVCHR
jgi:hypothetical protein